MFRAGIDLGGTNIKAGIVDENQKILAEGSVPTRVGRPYEEIMKDMAVLVKDLLKKIGADERAIEHWSGKSRYSGRAEWCCVIFQQF
jgi:glucokinase